MQDIAALQVMARYLMVWPPKHPVQFLAEVFQQCLEPWNPSSEKEKYFLCALTCRLTK